MFFNKPLTHLILIASIGLLAYSNTFDAPFQRDEAYYLEQNPIVRDLSFFLNPSKAEGLESYDSLKSRYVGYLTFALDYKIHGFDVTGYHVVNLLIHILSAISVYYLVRLTFGTPVICASNLLKGYSGYVALFSGVLFVSHPIQTEAVTYVFQRFASLAAMFYLLSIVLYAKWRIPPSPNPSRKERGINNNPQEENNNPLHQGEGARGRVILYVLSLLSALLAMKTKENAFTLPLMLCLYECFFFAGKPHKRALYLAPFFLMLLVFLPVSFLDAGADDIASLGLKEMPRTVYLFTEFRVIATYLRLLILPVNQNIDYDYPVFKSVFEIEVFLSLLLILLIAGFGFYLLRRSRSEPALRFPALGIFWFFVALSVESSIIPLPMFINEYRLYLPSVGAFLAFSTGLFLMFDRFKANTSKTAFIVSFIFIPVLLSSASYERNSVWKSRVSLWKDATEKSPNKSRTHSNLGLAYMSEGQGKKAIEEYLAALKLSEDPGDNPYNRNYRAKLHYDIGLAYDYDGKAEDAARHYGLASALWPDYAESRYKSALALEDKGLLDEALGHYLAAVSLKPDLINAHFHLGVAYFTKGQYEKAIEHYKLVIKSEPGDGITHSNLAVAYARNGDKEKAIEHFKSAIKINPKNPDARFNLAFFYFKNDFPDDARREFEEVLRLNPEDRKAREFLNRLKK